MTEHEAKSKVLDLARSELNYHESGSNMTKYASAYNFDNWLYGFDMNGQPWCDYFVDWLFMVCFGFDVGSAMTYQFAGCSGAACSASASYYRSNGAFYSNPEVGDQIFFYVDGDINHTGIVEQIENGYVTTIEGNSSDMVRRNKYPIVHSTIAGYGRPRWSYAAGIAADGSQNDSNSVSDESNINSPVTVKVSQNTLKFGSVGNSVKVLQAMLNYYGSNLDIDGEFGRLTENALKEYQSKNQDEDGNKLEIDGIAGKKTWRSMI